VSLDSRMEKQQQDDSESKEQQSISSAPFDLDLQLQEVLSPQVWQVLGLGKKISRALHLKNKTLLACLGLLGVGSASLASSFIWSSPVLTFIGLGLTLWGVLLMYISPSRHVRAELLNSISSSMQKSIENLVAYMGYTGQVVFFHPKSLTGLGQGFVFIPHYAAKGAGVLNSNLDALNALPYDSEKSIPPVYLDPKGVFLASPSQGMVDLFEKELGINFATVDLAFVQENLPKLLIEELKVVDDFSILEDNGNGVSIVMKSKGGPCTDMCQIMSKDARLGNHLACPLCSAIALVVSKVWGKPIIIKATAITGDSEITTTYVELTS